MRTFSVITLLIVAAGALPGLAGPAPVDFVKSVKPLLERSCIRCHTGADAKAGLHLDSREGVLKGGKSGAVVIPGKADQSKLARVVTLPAADPSRMPAQGDALTKAEVATLRAWINEGLKWPAGVTLTVPAPTATTIAPTGPIGTPPTAAETAAIAKLQAAGVHVMKLAQNVHLLRVDFSLRGATVKTDELTLLKSMANIVELSLAGTDVTDAALVHVKPLPNLERLQLQKTKVADAGLIHLKGLTKLMMLNLYATEVTDAGLVHLDGLKNLRNLYLWQSKATSVGANKLQAAISGLNVNLGVDVVPDKK